MTSKAPETKRHACWRPPATAVQFRSAPCAACIPPQDAPAMEAPASSRAASASERIVVGARGAGRGGCR